MGRGDCCVTRGVDSGEKTLNTTSAMNGNSHRAAKRGEKLQLRRRHWQLIPLEGGKFYGERLVEDIASSSSFSWVSFLGCLQKSFILFIQNNLLKKTMALWSPKKKENSAWVHNWLHQNNESCLISLFNVQYWRQRKLNYTIIPSAFSLAKKYNLLLKRLNCGHVKQTTCPKGQLSL